MVRRRGPIPDLPSHHIWFDDQVDKPVLVYAIKVN